MVWRADVVGAQGSSKHAYWATTGPATLPAGGCSKAEPEAGGARTSPPGDSGHLPELQGSKAEAQANTLSSFTGRAGQGIRPPHPGRSPFGDSLFANTSDLHNENSLTHTEPPNRSPIARRLRKPQHRTPWGSSAGSSTVSHETPRRSDGQHNQELTPSPVVILILNAMCILSEDRFLARSTSSRLTPRSCSPSPTQCRALRPRRMQAWQRGRPIWTRT